MRLPEFLEVNKVGISYEDVLEGIASPDVKKLFTESKEEFDSGESHNKYETALKERSKLMELYENCFNNHKLDALIYPTIPVEGKPIEDNMENLLVDGRHVNTVHTLIQNTSPGSFAGVPSLSLPLAAASNGLPIGIQIEALTSHDRLMFEIAAEVRDAVFATK